MAEARIHPAQPRELSMKSSGSLFGSGWIFGLMVSVLLLDGCTTAQMQVAPELQDSERLAVSGRQGSKIDEHLWFGPYEATAVDRSWVRGSDLQVLLYEGNKRRQRFTFTLREDGVDRWEVDCHASLVRRVIHTDVVDVEARNRSRLDCELQSLDAAGERWDLALSETRERPLAGFLSHDAEEIEVLGTRALEGGLPLAATTGYEVRSSGRPVAAVEVINDGAVWLYGTGAGERRSVLAATAAALLLLEDLRARLPEEPV
jgi:hypothetical protein